MGDRDAYLSRKSAIEDDLRHWQNYTTEARQMHIELMMCADAFNRLVGLWEKADDDGRQLLARGLFDEILFDLDEQRMTDFKLKPWAEQFLVIRGLQAGAEGTALPPAGIEPAPSPPEGDALSAELRGRKMASILVGFTGGRNPCHWKCRLNLR